MPDKVVLTIPPTRCGSRNIYALVRISEFTTSYSGYVSALPVALIIEEEGIWYYTILENNMGDDEMIETWLQEAKENCSS